MIVTRLEIPDVVRLLPRRIGDDRGSFCETYNRRDFEPVCGGIEFIQDNQAFSAAKNTLRGLHFQVPPMAQAKLIRVLSGAIFDVAVDLRRSSPSYGRHVRAILSAKDGAQLFIPAGFAHGYCTLEPDTVVFYKVDRFYSSAHDFGLAWNDPALGINWPCGSNAILSDRDWRQPLLRDLPDYFA